MATKEAVKPTAKTNGQTGVAKREVASTQLQTAESGAQLDIDGIAAAMKEQREGMEVTSEYLKFTEGETHRVAVIGLHRMASENSNAEDGKIECVRMITEEAKMAIAAQAIIVSTLRDAALRFQNGDPATRKLETFSITCTEYEDLGGGKRLARFSIKQLI